MRKIENQNKEFKQAWNENCLKTICAFSNTVGGKLYIGVDDAGKSVGVNDAARYLDEIPNKTKDTLEYPEDALREAVINAVIHRSYMGAQTQPSRAGIACQYITVRQDQTL